jgi:tRNA-dihydrouridine synthase
VGRLIASLAAALPVPVTAKIRLGWDSDELTYLDVARAVADHGGSLIAVHGRTRQQGYGGQADWDAIAEVKAAVPIPVLGNGDVSCVADIDRLRRHTACDGVMIGRGAMGNPWIFERRERSDVPSDEIFETALEHARRMAAYYGEAQGLLLFRKHLTRYLAASPVDDGRRTEILRCADLETLTAQLRFAMRIPN